MRTSVRHHVEIDTPAEVPWSIITRTDALGHWFPGLKAVEMTAPNVRRVTTGMGMSLDEEVVTNDPLQRRYQYRIAGGLFKEHLTTVDVFELGEQRCLVSYAADADPAVMAIVLGGAMWHALASLKEQCEAGAGPAIDAIAVPPIVPTDTATTAPDTVSEES